MKKQKLILVLLGLLPFAVNAEPMVVETVEKAFSTTIQSPDGKGSFILGGKKGQDIMRMAQTDDPLHLDVTVIGNLEKPECKRLRVRWSEARVIERKGAAPKDKVVVLRVSYCTDTQMQYGLAPDPVQK